MSPFCLRLLSKDQRFQIAAFFTNALPVVDREATVMVGTAPSMDVNVCDRNEKIK